MANQKLRDDIAAAIETCRDTLDKHFKPYECRRLTVDVVESIIKSFPAAWNFKFQGIVIESDKPVRGDTQRSYRNWDAFVVGTHDFGKLTFKIDAIDGVWKPNN